MTTNPFNVEPTDAPGVVREKVIVEFERLYQRFEAAVEQAERIAKDRA